MHVANRQHRLAAILCVALAVMTFAVFGQTIHHGFINFDDNEYVYENPVVSRGITLHGVAWAFDGAHASNWHPLTWLSHMLDCQLYGLNPGGHHLTNVLLHAITAIALFLVLRAMTEALWRSVFVAAVFAVHPLRVESVAWVAERKDLLSGLFFVLTIGAYARYARQKSPAHYGLVLVLFALGLMSKPMLVTLPLVLLLLDYWPLQRKEPMRKLILEKLPLAAVAVASCVITFLAQQRGIQSQGTFSQGARLANALVSYVVYLRQMVWPTGLAAFYPYAHDGAPIWELALAGVLVVGVSIFAWVGRRSRPWLFVGWAWYLVMLLPVLGIIQVGDQSHADRYTYLPQIGICLALIWPAAEWITNRTADTILMSAVVAVLMVCAWQQTAYWKDNETLWTHAIACTKDNAQAHNNLGTAYFNDGRMDDAMTECAEALRINPRLAMAHNILGIVLFQKGKTDEGIAQFQAALEITPEDAQVHNNLGNAYYHTGRLDDAVAQYEASLKTRPDVADTQYALGNILFQQGRMAEALAHLQKAVALNPGNQMMLTRLAWLLATCPDTTLRDGGKAVELARRANELPGGNNPLVLQTLAAAFAEAGQFPQAEATAQQALQLASTQPDSRLVGEIRYALSLYQAGSSFHLPQQAH